MNDLIRAFDLLLDVESQVSGYVHNILETGNAYHEFYQNQKTLLPYHLNIIDELRINENAHSRILCKLLQYKNREGKYEFLENLIKSISKTQPTFNNIDLIKPLITQEKARIDLWIRQPGICSIIFENKIYNADDKDAQISRYIEKTINEGFSEEQIYVVYLSQSGAEPESQTWGKYKERFSDRYINLSFRYDIRNWLTHEVLPHIRNKDNQLLCAINQYLDYLNGIFGDRNFEQPMNMKLQEFIKEKLNLKEDLSLKEKIRILSDNVTNISDLKNQMETLLSSYEKEYENIIFEKWQNNTVNHYPELSPNAGKAKSYPPEHSDTWACEVIIKILEKDYILSLARYFNGQLYCQIERVPEDKEDIRNSPVVQLKEKGILKQSSEWAIWKYFAKDEYDTAYKCFERSIVLLKNLQQSLDSKQ